jgi:hypothetical protein
VSDDARSWAPPRGRAARDAFALAPVASIPDAIA